MNASISSRLGKNPHLLIPAGLAWLRGWWYRILFRLQGKHFTAGPMLRVYGPLRISGPGRVRLGRNCLIISDAIKPVCIRTLARGATVTLGDHAGLNGTSIQCVQMVDIGEWSNIADAYITDTAAHTLSKQRRQQDVGEAAAAPVRIGCNVWISVQVVILHGVSIGDNSVIGACSLLRKDVPANVFGAGNPFKIIQAIED
jgi:acetyltransferase-like isoleucine patch superfamily enzyme